MYVHVYTYKQSKRAYRTGKVVSIFDYMYIIYTSANFTKSINLLSFRTSTRRRRDVNVSKKRRNSVSSEPAPLSIPQYERVHPVCLCRQV